MGRCTNGTLNGLENGYDWLKAPETITFDHPSIHVVELKGREPNCRISQVFMGIEDGQHPAATELYEEVDEHAVQSRRGCQSTVSPLLRRCNFNVEVTKPLKIVGEAGTVLDCGLAYNSECPNKELRTLQFARFTSWCCSTTGNADCS